MSERLSRTKKLIGSAGVAKLTESSVLIVGLGGVGGCVFEMLVRAGIGRLTVVDSDEFEESNLNRQILCTQSTLGISKTSAALLRAKDISPDCEVTAKQVRYCAQTKQDVFDSKYDYVADCIDSVNDKLDLIIYCKEKNIPVISAMGSGNRINPSFAVTDIYSTSGDGLAKVMRKRLRDVGIKSLDTVCDKGIAEKIDGVPGTVSYAPNLSGCVMAQKIITELLCKE